jgi:hypothetical protein
MAILFLFNGYPQKVAITDRVKAKNHILIMCMDNYQQKLAGMDVCTSILVLTPPHTHIIIFIL